MNQGDRSADFRVYEEDELFGDPDLDLDLDLDVAPAAAARHDEPGRAQLPIRTGRRRHALRFVVAVSVGAALGLALVTGIRLLGGLASRLSGAAPVVARPGSQTGSTPAQAVARAALHADRRRSRPAGAAAGIVRSSRAVRAPDRRDRSIPVAPIAARQVAVPAAGGGAAGAAREFGFEQ